MIYVLGDLRLERLSNTECKISVLCLEFIHRNLIISRGGSKFLNRGAQTHKGEYDGVLKSSSIVNCILTVLHTHTIDISDLYMN